MKLTPRWGSLPWALSSSFPAPLELPTGYYLEHFLILLDTVESRYGDLLDQKEREFLTTFHGLSLPAQRLYVRLVSRKGPVFRSDRLSYPEIPDLEETWLVLASEGFLTVNNPQWVGEAAALLTASELRDLGKELGLAIPQTTRKAEVLEMLHEQVPAEKRLSLFSGMFHWLCPSFQDVLRVFRLFFFGTPEPDLSAFVLSDLGKIRFEAYPLLSTHRLFTCREEIERALRIRVLRDTLSTIVEETEMTDQGSQVEDLTAALPGSGGHPVLTRWRRRFLEKAGRFWERQGNPNRALELYSDPETFPARERRATLLFRQGKIDDALATCQEILRSPRDPTEEEMAVKLLAKLSKGTPVPGPAIPDRDPKIGKSAHLSASWWAGGAFQPTVEKMILPAASGERIEKRVLEELVARGFSGFEAENRFWTSLFALLFWKIMYMPIPRAFGHPFQYGPADLFSAEFRTAREEAICARLGDLISGNSWQEEVLDLYRRKYGVANALISWDALPMGVLKSVLTAVPARHLAVVCDRLSRNPGGFKTGFPDLFLFSTEAPGYFLAEVKSPNDRVQNNQRSWMRYFGYHGIPCRVILVEYAVP